MNKIAKNIWLDLKLGFRGFFADYLRLFTASKRTAILLFIIEVFLGLIVILEINVIIHLIDALVGGKALKIVTSDILDAIKYQIILFVTLVPVLIIHNQFTGVAQKLGTTIRRVFLVGSLFIVGLPLAPSFFVVSLLAAYLIAYSKQPKVHWLFSAIIVGIAAKKFFDIIQISVYNGISVGGALYFGSALLVFTGYIALRPYLDQK